MECTLEQLQNVVEEMNKVMDLDPAIVADGKAAEELLAAIKTEATGGGKVDAAIRYRDFYPTKEDKAGEVKFSNVAKAFFVDLGVWDDKNGCPIVCADAEADVSAPEVGEAPGQPEAGAPQPGKTKKTGKAQKQPQTSAPAASATAAPAAGKTKEEGAMRKGTAAKKKKGAAKKDAGKASRSTATQKKEKKAPANLDAFGFREGSNTSEAIKFLATGKHTMAEAKEKFQTTFYSSFSKMKAAGHKVESNEDGTFKITAAKK